MSPQPQLSPMPVFQQPGENLVVFAMVVLRASLAEPDIADGGEYGLSPRSLTEGRLTKGFTTLLTEANKRRNTNQLTKKKPR